MCSSLAPKSVGLNLQLGFGGTTGFWEFLATDFTSIACGLWLAVEFVGISGFCGSLDSDFTSIGCGLNFLTAGDLGGKVGSSRFTVSISPTSFCLNGGGFCSCALLFSFVGSFPGGLKLEEA